MEEEPYRLEGRPGLSADELRPGLRVGWIKTFWSSVTLALEGKLL